MRVLATEREIDLRIATESSGLRIVADHDRVLQVLSNLIGNAVKFTPARGSITLRVERHHDLACISVADTGPGIPAEHLEIVFDRYWRGSTKSHQGTGLGLAIARAYAQAHGGDLLYDARDAGARFELVLPV